MQFRHGFFSSLIRCEHLCKSCSNVVPLPWVLPDHFFNIGWNLSPAFSGKVHKHVMPCIVRGELFFKYAIHFFKSISRGRTAGQNVVEVRPRHTNSRDKVCLRHAGLADRIDQVSPEFAFLMPFLSQLQSLPSLSMYVYILTYFVLNSNPFFAGEFTVLLVLSEKKESTISMIIILMVLSLWRRVQDSNPRELSL